MSHVVFRIASIPQARATVNAYFVYPGSPDRQVFFDDEDRTALEEILEVYSADGLACEPALAPAAREVGVPTRELTADEANQVGVMAFELAMPGQLTKVSAQAIYHFGTASRVYHEASPWKNQFAYETIGVALTGDIKRRLSARILGVTGPSAGLVLYSSPASIDQIVDRFEHGQLDRAESVDALGVTFEEAPGFAVDAMRRAYGLSWFPLPTKLRAGVRVAMEDEDFLILAASMRAVSALSDTSRESEAQIRVGDREVWVLAHW